MTPPFFGRVITAMVTPFDQNNQVNYAKAEELAAYLVANGSDGIVVCGTTGESPTLSWDEEHDLFEAVQNAVQGKAKVIVGTGSNCTQEAIEATQKAAEMGVDGSLQVVPYYNKPPQEGLYLHFRAIAESCDLPMMLYNVPGRTNTNLLPETVTRLAKVENIVAIKEASGIMEQASQIRQLAGPDFGIYSGDDSLTLPLLAVGGVGIVSVASHLVGNEIQAMVQAFLNGQINEALAIHLQLFPLFKVLFCTTNPIPVKAALNLQGWNLGGLRSPMVEITEIHKQEVKKVLEQLDLLKN
ncbi:MAG: 4-hydroxy-tetrahydrodipicolinate synthase [Microcystaceae cyanobacterium]